MTWLDPTFRHLRRERRKALIPYVTAGYPGVDGVGIAQQQSVGVDGKARGRRPAHLYQRRQCTDHPRNAMCVHQKTHISLGSKK